MMGGSADVIADVVGRGFKPGLSLAAATKLAVSALGADGGPNATPRQLGVDALEVAILDRSRALPRKFRRITGDRLAALLEGRDRAGGSRHGDAAPLPGAVGARDRRRRKPVTSAPPPVSLIVGTGLIGASIGCALTAAGYRVHLQDRQSSHARVAAGGGRDRRGTGPGRGRPGPGRRPARRDRRSRGGEPRGLPGATVTDVGSVKAGVLDTLWRRSVDLRRYVGSHPMAGSQHSGPMTARADLFADRAWVVTPHRRSDPASVQLVTAAARACRARPLIMDVDEHDAAVARVSHLPHLMSVLMAGHLTTVPETDLVLAGQGLRDVTRVAASDPSLWGADRRRQLCRGAHRAA